MSKSDKPPAPDLDPYGELLGRTSLAVGRVSDSKDYKPPDENSPYGYFKGHHIIGRESAVSGGVYLGGGSREAIAVIEDDILETVYSIFVKPKIQTAKLSTQQILEIVFQEVKNSMPYSKDIVNNIIFHDKKDGVMPLSKFILNKGGVCRHQALFAAYLLERLVKDGLIQGKASSRRNYIRFRGAHAWAQYINNSGAAYVIDPAQNYCGPFDNTPSDGWRYEGPTPKDIEKIHDLAMLEDREVDPAGPARQNPNEAPESQVVKTITTIRSHVRELVEAYALPPSEFGPKMLEFETIAANRGKLDDSELITQLGEWESEFYRMKNKHRKWLYESQKEETEIWRKKLLDCIKQEFEKASTWEEAVKTARNLWGKYNVALSPELEDHSSNGITTLNQGKNPDEFEITNVTERSKLTKGVLETQTLFKNICIGGQNFEYRIIHVNTTFINYGRATPIFTLVAIKRKLDKDGKEGSWIQE